MSEIENRNVLLPLFLFFDFDNHLLQQEGSASASVALFHRIKLNKRCLYMKKALSYMN